jgi:hypothetical protein
MSERDYHETYWPMVEAVRQMMTACERAGAISPGADAEDFLQLLACVLQLPPTVDGAARAKRLLALVFRGLGAG